jgi:membrane-associated phospholipid phosphatase
MYKSKELNLNWEKNRNYGRTCYFYSNFLRDVCKQRKMYLLYVVEGELILWWSPVLIAFLEECPLYFVFEMLIELISWSESWEHPQVYFKTISMIMKGLVVLWAWCLVLVGLNMAKQRIENSRLFTNWEVQPVNPVFCLSFSKRIA